MVIGEGFAWAHVPKTGGDATLKMFKVFPELVVRADERGTNLKHALFEERQSEIRGKLLLLNLRRLPSWLLSHAVHASKHGLFPDYQPGPLPAPAQLAERDNGDQMLNAFLYEGKYEVSRWLRMEYLREDFLAFVSDLTDVSALRRLRVRRVGRVNEDTYNHSLRSWFRDSHLELMYDRNPLWTELERKVYGGTLLDRS